MRKWVRVGGSVLRAFAAGGLALVAFPLTGVARGVAILALIGLAGTALSATLPATSA